MSFTFGDILINEYASIGNPHRVGTFVKSTFKGFELTDMKGNFWITAKDNHKLKIVGTIVVPESIQNEKVRECYAKYACINKNDAGEVIHECPEYCFGRKPDTEG